MTVMISLIGEQPIPNLLALRHEKPRGAALVSTQLTRHVAERLQGLMQQHTDTFHLLVDPYDIQSIYKDLIGVVERNGWHNEDLVFNLTGGTKTMVLAAYQIAIELRSPIVYLQSERSRTRLYRYEIHGRVYRKISDEFLPELINIDDYIYAYLGQPPRSRKKPRDEFGQAFEEAIAEALREIGLDVKVGVHLAGALEVDLIVRCENQVGVIQAKTGGSARKKTGLDQLNAVCDQRYLGTYTKKILAINVTWDDTLSNLQELANAWKITVIELPSFTENSRSLSEEEKTHLQSMVLERLCPHRLP